MVLIEWLPFGVFLEQGLGQAGKKIIFIDICAGVMDKYTGLHIAVRIDMAIVPAAGYAAADVLAIILEVQGHEGFARFQFPDFTNPVNHIGPLLPGRQKIQGCTLTHRHVMEVPGVPGALTDEHVNEVIGGDCFNVLPGIAYGCTIDDTIFMEQVHGMHHFVKVALTTAAVVYFSPAFNGDGEGQVPNFTDLPAEIVINESTIGKCMELAVRMGLAELQDIRFSYERFPAGHHVEMDAQCFTLGDNLIHHIVGQVQGVAVLSGPASDAVAVTGTGWIKKDDPGNIDTILLPVFPPFLITIEGSLEAQVHDCGLDDVGIQGIQCPVQIFPPFMVVHEELPHTVKGGGFKHIPIDLLDHIGKANQGFSSFLFILDRNNMVYQLTDSCFLYCMC